MIREQKHQYTRDRISQVNKLVFFYGNVAAEWVSERMKAALQLILSNQYPVKDFFVFMLPPHKDPNDKISEQQFKGKCGK